MKELFVLIIDGVEKSLSLQDGNSHHLLDFRHVLLEDMLVELIDSVVSFLLDGFGHGIEIGVIGIQAKRVWVEVNILYLISFLSLESFDEDWSLLFDKLSVINLEIGKLFATDGLELVRLNDLCDFTVLIGAVLDFEVVLDSLSHDSNESFFEFVCLFIH